VLQSSRTGMQPEDHTYAFNWKPMAAPADCTVWLEGLASGRLCFYGNATGMQYKSACAGCRHGQGQCSST
jgi:hypothetical protein